MMFHDEVELAAEAGKLKLSAPSQEAGQPPDPRPASMLRPVEFSLDDDEPELRRVPVRPISEAEEAEDVW